MGFHSASFCQKWNCQRKNKGIKLTQSSQRAFGYYIGCFLYKQTMQTVYYDYGELGFTNFFLSRTVPIIIIIMIVKVNE